MTWKVPAGPLKFFIFISAVEQKCTFLLETQLPLFLSLCLTGKRKSYVVLRCMRASWVMELLQDTLRRVPQVGRASLHLGESSQAPCVLLSVASGLTIPRDVL